MNIRTLNADEIECRVSTVKKTKYGVGCSLLLYKDARCDMRIMDETFGQMNWARQHELIGNRLYCIVSVYDAERGQWVSKQDVGTESNTEKEKGQASDSFKRACTNWGIGRELYTAPFIWVNLHDGEYYERNNKYGVNTRFCVSEIGYNDKREINKLTILDENGNQRYFLHAGGDAPEDERLESNKSRKNKPQQEPKPEPPKPKPTKEETIKSALETKTLESKRYLIELCGMDTAQAGEMWRKLYQKAEGDIVQMNEVWTELKEKVERMHAIDA